MINSKSSRVSLSLVFRYIVASFRDETGSARAATSSSGLATDESRAYSRRRTLQKRNCLNPRRGGCNRSENVNRGDNDPAGVVRRVQNCVFDSGDTSWPQCALRSSGSRKKELGRESEPYFYFSFSLPAVLIVLKKIHTSPSRSETN